MARTLIVVTAPKSAFREIDIPQIEAKFKQLGYDAVVITFGNNSVGRPICTSLTVESPTRELSDPSFTEVA